MWPLFTHGNGPSSNDNLYQRIKVSAKKKEMIQKVPDELTVITWSIPKEKSILEELMKNMNAELYIIPFTKPFEWTGKVTKTLEYLKYVETPYVMGLDALDVIPSTDEGNLWEEAIEHFKKKNVDILFNAEKSSWPDMGFGTSLSENHPLIFRLKKCLEIENKVYGDMMGSEYKHLNTGCWIAKTDAMINFYKDVNNLIQNYEHEIKGENYFGGEQGFVRALSPEYYPKLIIDHKCQIFQTLVNVTEDEIVIEDENVNTTNIKGVE